MKNMTTRDYIMIMIHVLKIAMTTWLIDGTVFFSFRESINFSSPIIIEVLS